MDSAIDILRERRTQAGSTLRAYIEEFGYHRVSTDESGNPRFMNPDGYILTQEQIERSSRYIGFAEARFGLPRNTTNSDYMEGYNAGIRRISGRFFPITE